MNAVYVTYIVTVLIIICYAFLTLKNFQRLCQEFLLNVLLNHYYQYKITVWSRQ